MDTRIVTLEDVSFRAWPALETRLYDGWVLRFADGYTRRSNSVNPIYNSGDTPLAEKLHFCEQMYKERGLPVVYKMTPAAVPDGLDDALAEAGYERDVGALMQASDLMNLTVGLHPNVTIETALTDKWVSDFVSLNEVDARHIPAMRRVLANIRPEQAFMTLKKGDEPVAVGLAVCEDGNLGLFDIVTARQYRRQGNGRALLESLLAWGISNGARVAYLQVKPDNEPALGLYAKLGFSTAYEYWYRTLP